MAEPQEILWEGQVGEDRYRVAGYDDGYGGLAWAVEVVAAEHWTRALEWASVSSGPNQDAPEVAAVAAAIAQELKEVRDGE